MPAGAQPPGPDAARSRIAILDVGSNSIRLVVYHDHSRSPAILFNEKVMAGLGRGLRPGGLLADSAMESGVAALRRFALLLRGMGVDSLRAVATAAVRNAANGVDFIDRIRRESGIAVEIIDGRTEAIGSAAGVLSGIPDADGIVGDLGGGSLELVHVAGGRTHEHASLPLGVLRLAALHRQNPRGLAALITSELSRLDWLHHGASKPFYAVGGSWRALFHLHMHLSNWPLPVVHSYRIEPAACDRLIHSLAHSPASSLKRVPSLSAARIPDLPAAAVLLRSLARRLDSSAILASAFGLREGLLFQSLPPAVQAEDPLLAGAREAARRGGRFSDGSDAATGDALLSFTDGLFGAEPPALRRLRHAASLLADTSWRAHPDLRAEDAMDQALNGTWGGIDGEGRAMLAMALWAVNGGNLPGPHYGRLARLAPAAGLETASCWGLALRLGKRLGGGMAAPLSGARLGRGSATTLDLALDPALHALYGPAVERRHQALARAMKLSPRLLLSPLPAR